MIIRTLNLHQNQINRLHRSLFRILSGHSMNLVGKHLGLLFLYEITFGPTSSLVTFNRASFYQHSQIYDLPKTVAFYKSEFWMDQADVVFVSSRPTLEDQIRFLDSNPRSQDRLKQNYYSRDGGYELGLEGFIFGNIFKSEISEHYHLMALIQESIYEEKGFFEFICEQGVDMSVLILKLTDLEWLRGVASCKTILYANFTVLLGLAMKLDALKNTPAHYIFSRNVQEPFSIEEFEKRFHDNHHSSTVDVDAGADTEKDDKFIIELIGNTLLNNISQLDTLSKIVRSGRLNLDKIQSHLQYFTNNFIELFLLLSPTPVNFISS